MQIPLEIAFHNMDSSDAVEAHIREKADKLERYFDRIVACRVVIEAPHKHSRKGKLFDVRIGISVPGKEIQVNRAGLKDHAHEDVYVAIRDAFAAAGRQVDDHARKVRGDIKTHEAPPHGKVARLFPHEGYGFVAMSDGREIYFHKNSVVNERFDELDVGVEVRVVEAAGENAEGPRASTVTPIGKHHIVE